MKKVKKDRVSRPKKLNRIAEVLSEKGISQYQVAKDTGISPMSIHRYVHGKSEPTLPNLFSIAGVIKVNPKDLLNS